MTNISSIVGTGQNSGSTAEKKTGVTQGGDIPAGAFEDDEQRLVHQHKRNAKDVGRHKGGRKPARRLISL